ncbi:MAG: segregation/condensation protein A [Nanoarchaeota archaeon]|nr:segregation/condensation protein A [Nanoarchaeota archaeon]
MQDQIYNLLIQKDELTWQNIIYDLIKSKQINPWDIDISLLSKKYLERIKQMKESNLFISGKVVLASSILLKIKSYKLVTEEILNFDNKMNPPEEYQELEELLSGAPSPRDFELPKLTIKTPMPRKRKVTLNDLMSALQKALEVNQRRFLRRESLRHTDIKIPEKKVDISNLILEVYNKIMDFFKTKKETLTFTKLVNSPNRQDKILTFIPLLHLDNQEKINLEQKEHFGEINIKILNKKHLT